MLIGAKLPTYAAGLVEFCLDLEIQTASGVRPFRAVAHPAQVAWLRKVEPAALALARGSKAALRKFFMEATKGFGKDLLVAMVLAWLVVFSPRTLLIQVAADDFDQASETTDYLKEFLRLNTLLDSRFEVQATKAINPATETTVEILTRDKYGSHGARPDLLVLNELSHVTDEDFASTLMDNAAKMAAGVVIIASNAGFLDSWQYRWRELARQSADWDFHQFAKPAPWLNANDIAEAEQRNTRSRFRRLFWGEASSGSGDAIEDADIAAAVRLHGPMSGDEKNWQFMAGLDLATRSDHAALVVLGCNSREHRVAVALCQAWKPIGGRVDLQAVLQATLQAHKRYHLLSVHFDPYQAELMSQQLHRYGVNMVEVPMVGANLNRMATAVLNAFRGRQIDLYPEAALLRDLRKLKLTERSFGYKLEAAADADGHADRAIAMAIALPAAMELSSHGFTGEMPVPIAAEHRLENLQRRGVQLQQRAPLASTVRFTKSGDGPRWEKFHWQPFER